MPHAGANRDDVADQRADEELIDDDPPQPVPDQTADVADGIAVLDMGIIALNGMGLSRCHDKSPFELRAIAGAA